VEHLYEVPLLLEEQGLGRVVERALGLEPVFPNLAFWQEAVRILKNPERTVRIAIAGKYVKMPDAYLSLLEALKHAGIKNRARVEVKWVDAESLEAADLDEAFADVAGILVRGGLRARCGPPSTPGRGRSPTWASAWACRSPSLSSPGTWRA
jgi:CTP synthase